MKIAPNELKFGIGGFQFPISRPHPFGIVFEGAPAGSSDDYLHEVLLNSENRSAFLTLIENEGLVVCKNVRTSTTSYRKVRGKSSYGRLSQAEYYHHDGCSCPQKPRVVEIRFPYQDIERNVSTAVARLPDILRAMFLALPRNLKSSLDIAQYRELYSGPVERFPSVADWDKAQGRVTRLVRREMDAESARSYFRDVDHLACAYDAPWEMGESRLISNNQTDLAKTMQHRRAYQLPRQPNQQNGGLVKRWTAEET